MHSSYVSPTPTFFILCLVFVLSSVCIIVCLAIVWSIVLVPTTLSDARESDLKAGQGARTSQVPLQGHRKQPAINEQM